MALTQPYATFRRVLRSRSTVAVSRASTILLGLGWPLACQFTGDPRRKVNSIETRTRSLVGNRRHRVVCDCPVYAARSISISQWKRIGTESQYIKPAHSFDGRIFSVARIEWAQLATCHRPAEGFGISASEVALRFLLTAGNDPIFRTNDGSNCDQNISVSTLQGRAKAYSLLISRGLIRIALSPPAGAEFTVTDVENPYGCGSTQTLSMYRRPLPSTNLRFPHHRYVGWPGIFDADRHAENRAGNQSGRLARRPCSSGDRCDQDTPRDWLPTQLRCRTS